MHWATLVLMVALGAAAWGAWAVYRGDIEFPERFNPWAPLDVAAPPDWLTDFKLRRARSDPQRCQRTLAQTGMTYDALPDRTTGAGCGFENAVRLRATEVRLGAPLPLSCPMALSFFMWERHALQPAAQTLFGQRVTGIEHVGSYACRNINRGEGGASGAARSRHATADALDITAFALDDGRRITVAKDWRTGNDASGPVARLLHEAHRGGCRWFDGALGPDYNAAHRDHFHFETGGFNVCR